MGAKRAVPGRSLPYDMLLLAKQKKNQAKQQNKVAYVSPPASDPVVAVKPANPHPITAEEIIAVLPPTGISISTLLKLFPGRIPYKKEQSRFIKMVKENATYSVED